MASNPYRSPSTSTSWHDVPPESVCPRYVIALRLGAIGAMTGGIVCSVGFLLVVTLLDFFCVPPLRSPANYGQFQLFVIYFAAFGLLYGASLAILPYSPMWSWLLAFLLITLVMYGGSDLAIHFDVTHIWYSAQFIVLGMFVFAAFIISLIVGRRDWNSSTGKSGAS